MEITVPDVGSLKARTSTNEILLRLYQYWDEKRGEKLFPARTDLDLLEFTYALSWVSLVDVEQSPLRFHYRLVSTTLTDRLGYEMTHRYTDDIPEEDTRRYVQKLYARCVDQRMPIYEKSTRAFAAKIWEHEALVLPLSSNQEAIDMLMVYRATFDPKPLRLG